MRDALVEYDGEKEGEGQDDRKTLNTAREEHVSVATKMGSVLHASSLPTSRLDDCFTTLVRLYIYDRSYKA